MPSDTDIAELEPKLPTLLVLFLSEVLGTFILIFFGCMGVNQQIVDGEVAHHFIGLSFGLMVMVSVNVVGHVSGSHINPQMTIGALILGKIKLLHVPIYFLAQFVGAIMGMGFLKLVTPSVYYADNMCCTELNNMKKVTIMQGLAVEILLTFTLVLFLGSILDRRNLSKHDSMPLRFGLAVSGFAMVAGSYTGGSMNTARSFAPALVNNYWKDQWVYWVGPTIGSVLGAAFYRFVLEPPVKK